MWKYGLLFLTVELISKLSSYPIRRFRQFSHGLSNETYRPSLIKVFQVPWTSQPNFRFKNEKALEQKNRWQVWCLIIDTGCVKGCETILISGGGGGGGRGVRTSRLPPFFAFLPSPSKLEDFKTRISHKAVPGRTIRRPFIIHFFTIYILINVNIIDRFCTPS